MTQLGILLIDPRRWRFVEIKESEWERPLFDQAAKIGGCTSGKVTVVFKTVRGGDRHLHPDNGSVQVDTPTSLYGTNQMLFAHCMVESVTFYPQPLA